MIRRVGLVGALVALAAALVLGAGCAGRPPGPASPTVPGGVVSVQAEADVPVDWVARLRADVASAVGDVAGPRPGSWARRVDVRLVASDVRLRAVAGWAVGGPVGTVAAVAVLPVPGSSLASSSSSPPGEGGGRLVVDLDVYRRLTADGRRIVLRHELTHLATAAETPAGMPVWLVEGFADEIGHEGVTGLPVDRAAAELAVEVRAGRVPTTLPADAAFDGSDGRLAQTYQEAWLACRLLAGRLGVAGLAHFYRDVGARLAGPLRATPAGNGAGDTASAVAAALRADAGMGWSAFVADWR
ncbi:hypothetical protein I6A60_25525, partial [Frankia sp. AgB1.9]